MAEYKLSTQQTNYKMESYVKKALIIIKRDLENQGRNWQNY